MLLALTGIVVAANLGLTHPRVGKSVSDTTPVVHVQVDSSRQEIVLTAGPFTVPAMPPGIGHEHGDLTPALRFASPVAGWIRGYRIELRDASGDSLPRELIHHVGVVDFDRRALVYPMYERLFAGGKETEAVMLPATIGVPVRRGEEFGLYAGLHDEGGHAIRAAFIRVIIAWTPERRHDQPVGVRPFYVEVKSDIGGHSWYDIPPGRSRRSAVFDLPVSGRLLAIGGHLHDYAEAVSMEDAQTGKVLVRLTAKRDRMGQVLSVGRFIFGYNVDALHLAANHPYRIVAEYDNPTGAVIRGGAMAALAGPFVPDGPHAWPALDRSNPEVRKDLASLTSADDAMTVMKQ